MNRSLVAQFVLRFQDRASAGIGALQRRLQGLAQAARRIALLGGIGAGLSFAGPISGAAAMETRLRDVAVTAGTTGGAISGAVERMRGELNELALQYRLTTSGLLGAAEVLTARGLDPAEVQSYTRVIAQVGAASNAAENDLAQLSVALNRISGIRDEGAQRQAMAQAFRAGQLGGVELKDMARYLPGILGQMQPLQATGLRAVQNSAAMFQVIRDQMGTTEEAAGGLQQMIGHIFSESTQRNARDLGLDLRAIFGDAVRQMRAGVDIDPIEALVQRMRQALVGREERLGELLPDQNSRLAFNALNSQFARYLEIRNELRRTDGGAVDRAVTDRTTGLGADMRELTERSSQLGNRLGTDLGTNLVWVNSLLAQLQGWIRSADEAFPGVITKVISFGGGALVLATALGTLGFVMGPLGAGLGLLLSPIGLAVAAVAALGLAAWQLWENWEPIAAWFTGLWNDLRAGMQPQIDWLLDVLDGAGALAVGLFMAAWNGIVSWATGLWETVTGAFSTFSSWVMSWAGGPITAVVTAIMAPFAGLTAWFATLWEGIRAPFDAFISGIMGTIERVTGAWNALRNGSPAQVTLNAVPPPLGSVQERQAAARAAAVAARNANFPSSEQLAGAANGNAPVRAQPVSGEIFVQAAPGAEIVSTESANSNVPLTAQNRGGTRERP